MAHPTGSFCPNEPMAPTDAPYSVRAFGTRKADLDFDFATNDRPGLVTDVLSACLLGRDGSPLATDRVWAMPVSQRIECLLRLAAAGHTFVWSVTLRCPRDDCRQLIEIELPIDDVLALQRRAEQRDLAEWQDGALSLRLRRPTGGDQRQWRAASFADATEARDAIFHTLVADAPGPEGGAADGDAPRTPAANLIEMIDARLEEFDPLVAFSVQVGCPHCGLQTDFPVDLEALALSELEKVQTQLLQDLHRLATHYHWSESEILDLTPQRRARYLQLIEAGEAS